MNLPALPAHHSLPVSRFHVPMPIFRYLHRLVALLVLFATLSTPTVTNATVVIPVADTDLARQSSVIVIGRIAKLKSIWDKNHEQIFTKITLSIDEVLKGQVRKRRLTVIQTGGVVGNIESWIDGNPDFTVGEKVLLFLSRNQEGHLHVLHMYQGKFSVFIDTESGMEMAYREAHPEGVHVLAGGHTNEQRSVMEAGDTPAMENGFLPLADLKTRIHNALTNPQVSSPSQTLASSAVSSPAPTTAVRQEAPFTILGTPAARWFEPDSGQWVTMRINPVNSLAGATAAAQSALAAWTGVVGSSFRFQDGGSTTAAGLTYDGVNSIAFGDPRGQINLPAKSSYVNPSTGKPYCSGVLAIGGYFRSGNITTIINGQTYYKIIEGDLVFADDWDGCDNGFGNPLIVAEVAAHELGHVIGLGHSADPNATMYAYAHFDGRGASIRTDDIAGLRSVYPATTTPTAPTCTYTVSPANVSIGAGATNSSVNVTPTSGTCTWTTTSVPSWITIASGVNGTGTGTVSFSIAANTSTSVRSAPLTIAGQSVTVTQAGTSSTSTCSFRVPSFPISLTASRTLLSITLGASSSTCRWNVSSPVSWITISSGGTGTRSNTVTFLIAANSSSKSRSAILTIAGKPVTINQSGKK